MGERKTKEVKVATTTTVFTVNEAAQHLGIQPSVMRNYLYEGLFTTLKFKDTTYVDPDEVKEWQRERQK